MPPASRAVNAAQKNRGESPEPWGRYGWSPGRSQNLSMLMDAKDADQPIKSSQLSASGPELRA